MTLDQARQIVDLLHAHTDVEAEVCEGYSGRGMDGETCVAIATDDPVAVGWAAGKLGFWYDECPMRRDSIAHEVIVY